ncbi:IMP cyclohydrolase /phosphoribosylaminoimidazolecarboxamide formyltransferase [Saccharicrinis carchari]|uniref:Bifunctional purine biosynthesis protein PurH n=1 Tax=Saccharicrinis carchari TaxID=1168039 RepID=A0A521D522_SACCC|nr:bifunctional phosphoribosylaminoimidazolecarboxamide formyltransferase/IMP cyclohydrolase [Saccharicrinis carchari]SMO66712.1 IMP cyclohydrolase /phosphoribosylaminoimidazolecarboxamide formyltransferase [Saccharicrinis carchari]
MIGSKKIKSALISVFHKDGLDEIIKTLNKLDVQLYSTGGTQTFIENLGVEVKAVEDITGYPSILGGRVKTLHPKVFGGILARRHNSLDKEQLLQYDIPEFDLVIVDLYPFEATVASGAGEQDIIEKIDIGGISLIRAAAKNYNDVLIVPSKAQYAHLNKVLNEDKGISTIAQRKEFAKAAFAVSSYYDSAIFNYFDNEQGSALRIGHDNTRTLRYGENPHQKGKFYGNLDEVFEQIHGKEISYNNLLDIDAAINLIGDFNETTFAILKHNNACGLASRENLTEAWKDALAADPVSAFGGVLIANKAIDLETAQEINKIFFEVIITPAYNEDALEVLRSKKNRIILILKPCELPNILNRTLLNGVLSQQKDIKTETSEDLKTATTLKPDANEVEDLLFANKLVKHTKSNAIVLAKNKQLIASGVGQTSRVDALNQAIAKAKAFNFELQGAVMASDAFFPFPDCVEIAQMEGVKAVIQPGGSIKDQDSVDYCNQNGMKMVLTGIRHFKH